MIKIKEKRSKIPTMSKRKINKRCRQSGFSLVELMLTVAIVAVVIVGLVQLFIYCSSLTDLSRNLTTVMAQAQTKMEEIHNHNYALITADYISGGTPGNTFNSTKPTGKGVIYIDSSNADLLKVEIMVSWRNQKNRIIGEDTDLDGVVDTGEDLNSNGKLDSIATVVSYIAKR